MGGNCDERPPHDERLNVGFDIDVPESANLSDATDAIRSLVEGCETIRTTYSLQAGQPLQHIHSNGSFFIDIAEIENVPPNPHFTDALITGERIDIAKAIPLRATILTSHGSPKRLFIALPCIAADISSLKLMKSTTERALRGHRGNLGWTHPIDRVAFESSDSGAAVNSGALAHWEKGLRSLERSIPIRRTPVGNSDSFPHRRILSQGLPAAVDVIKRRNRTVRSAIYFGAIAERLLPYTESNRILLPIMCSNRALWQGAPYMGVIAQRSLAIFEKSTPQHISTSPQTAAATLSALKYGAYDAFSFREMEKKFTQAFTGIPYHANFISDQRDETPVNSTTPVTQKASSITNGTHIPSSTLSFWMEVREKQESTALSMFGNSGYFTRQDIDRILRGIEGDLFRVSRQLEK